MMKSGIDQDALVTMFSEATANQGEALRKAVSHATLKALQSRELTLANMRSVLKTVTEATSAGAAKSGLPMPDVEGLLTQAFAGMDAALLKTVEANRKALEQFVGQGVDVQEKQMKSALANLEKMEDMFFTTVGKAAQGAGAPLKGPWDQVLEAMKLKGTVTGAGASQTVEQMLGQAQTTLRDSRATSLKAAQAMIASYSTLVSGVLIGMSEALQPHKGPKK
jgi:flagellar hook-basal body complex protein FliE